MLRGGMLLITFSTGEQRLFDTTLLTGSAFETLKDVKTLADKMCRGERVHSRTGGDRKGGGT